MPEAAWAFLKSPARSPSGGFLQIALSNRLTRLRRRAMVLYGRRRRLFWTLHSLWALATGAVILVLAHERYDFAVWVVLFLGLTWASTLFFSRLAATLPDSPKARLGKELASYLTRAMYQETLFFLLPFYFSSATWPSANFLFVALLAGLAIMACLDLVFDEMIRQHRWFGLLFFGLVAFASLAFLFPVLAGLQPDLAVPISAVLGLGAALPLVYDRSDLRRLRAVLVMVGAVVLAVLATWLGRPLIPPVPLWVDSLEFSAAISSEELEPAGPPLRKDGPLPDQLVAIAEIFAPRILPTRLELRWKQDGVPVRHSREVTASPHEWGFRVWDAYRPESGLEPGSYTVEVRTGGGQLIGRRSITLSGAPKDGE